MISTASFFLLVVTVLADSKLPEENLKLKILTVATEETDGFRRFMRSAKEFNLDVEVLGLGVSWVGGDVRNYPGGGQKVGLLREALEDVQDKEDTIILFADSYDVILNAPAEEILSRFRKHFADARVVFSAEGFCWPDKSLAVKYPVVRHGKRYLCSGLFMGYASEVYKMVSHKEVKDTDDDQLYYTEIFLDDHLRVSHLQKIGPVFVFRLVE